MKNTILSNDSNKLKSETSPYLLQHANNPVDWYPWGDEALNKAKAEDKLIIISIGYSACHWCHVMEHESFEDSAVAEIMNSNFVSIKVDREERPDVDNVYMDALHLMGQRGGWPLNCIALPDGRPIYGGTYFPKEDWMSILQQLTDVYADDKQKMLDYAQKLSDGLKQQTVIQLEQSGEKLSENDLDKLVSNWSNQFDYKWGGDVGAPKFPMPNGLSFLLRYYYFTENAEVKKYLEITLDKMAAGGIYDHLGGGFARYSTDEIWKAPHFEKMLYDNAQLISLYSEAYKLFKKPRYKQVVYETIEFVNRELSHSKGGFYAALDADSEGVEGKYYVWMYEELSSLLGDDFDVYSMYYEIEQNGNWEEGVNIVYNTKSLEKVAEESNKTKDEVLNILTKSNQVLFEARQKRVRPGTDTKILTSWNALAISAYVDAYRAFNEKEFLKIAIRQGEYLKSEELFTITGVKRMKLNTGNFVPGFLDDYALLAKAYIDLYQATFDEKWLSDARKIAELSIEYFYNQSSEMFMYSRTSGEQLFAQKIEIADNVIPSSNSVMANVLHQLGIYFSISEWTELSNKMLLNVTSGMIENGRYYSNWAILACHKTYTWPEVVLVGADALSLARQIDHDFHFYQLAGSLDESSTPLLKNRYQQGRTPIYVCENQSCKLPVFSVDKAIELLQE